RSRASSRGSSARGPIVATILVARLVRAPSADSDISLPLLCSYDRSMKSQALPHEVLLEEGQVPGDPRVDALASHVREMIRILGLDPETDPNLVDTDRRVAKMYLDIFSGLDEGTKPLLTTFPNDEHYTSMVMEKEIPFYSMCAHHFV